MMMTSDDTAFAFNLRSMIGAWEALAAPRVDARVIHGNGFVAARFAEPYLNNAVILDPAAVAPAAQVYHAGDPFALWCRDDDREISASLADHGYVHSETTRLMMRYLDDSLDTLSRATEPVLIDVDLERFAELIEVPSQLFRGVVEARAYATEGFDSGLMLQRVDADVHVSMVFTRPAARRRGLAAATLTTALRDARRRGARTATLQSTPMAENLYTRYGFEPVGRWQEWIPVA